MHAIAYIAIYLAAHITGAIQTIAPVFGQVGQVISTTDKAVADAVKIQNYVKAKRKAKHK